MLRCISLLGPALFAAGSNADWHNKRYQNTSVAAIPSSSITPESISVQILSVSTSINYEAASSLTGSDAFSTSGLVISTPSPLPSVDPDDSNAHYSTTASNVLSPSSPLIPSLPPQVTTQSDDSDIDFSTTASTVLSPSSPLIPLPPPQVTTRSDDSDVDFSTKTSGHPVATYRPSGSPLRFSNTSSTIPTISTTSVSNNSRTTSAISCTGCVIQAYNPITTFYVPNDPSNPWTSTFVTETILTRFTTYIDNNTIETIVTQIQTVNQTKTVTGTANETITHQTPTFTIEPTPGVFLTFDAGPTYVVYKDFFGGPDNYVQHYYPGFTGQDCVPVVTTLQSWQPAETATEQWSHLIVTHNENLTSTNTGQPYPLPSKVIDYLKQDPDIQMQFNGSDIATCTLSQTSPSLTFGTLLPSVHPAPTGSPAFSRSPFSSSQLTEPTKAPDSPITTTETAEFPSIPTTGTFIRTTFESTSVHVTVRGCLRCDPTNPFSDNDLGRPTATSSYQPTSVKPTQNKPTQNKPTQNKPTQNKPTQNQPTQNKPTQNQPTQNKPTQNQPTQNKPTQNQPTQNQPTQNQPTQNQPTQNQPTQGNPSTVPNIPGTRQTPAVTATKSVTIGGSVFPINTPKPTQVNVNTRSGQNQNGQNTAPPVVIIGTATLTPGQSTTINGVPVGIPTNGGGTRIVVDGSTVAFNPTAPTGAPVLTIGEGTVTANSQGNFVFGTETLKPGGAPITVNGNTISLGPSGVAIVNGVTQTFANAPAPTAPPALTVGGQTISATVVGGSTVFVVAPGQTLAPGGTLVVDGTTFSMPADGQGSTIVVNGQTSTLTNGQSALTLANGRAVSATIVGGSTGFVVAPGQTLTPGGSLVVDGTTFSMPSNGRGSTILVNGETSILNAGQTVITLAGGRSVTAQVIGGTTAYVLAPGQTLTPGGSLVVDGTTFSMPSSGRGSTILVNGQSSILSAGQSVYTLAGGRAITAQVISGTTAYILAPGQTLTPGGVLTISGTTYSMPTGASGTVIVINGVTTTLPAGAAGSITAAPALTINDITYTPTVRDGTTEYVLGDGTTLAPGSTVEMDGTTYSLDEAGTALIINGKTSTIPNLPKSTSVTTTGSASLTTTSRNAGDIIASGIGESGREPPSAGVSLHGRGWEVWVQGMVVGAVGWVVLLL